MAKKKKVLRLVAIGVCLVILFGFSTGFRVSANESPDYYKAVSNAEDLLKAIETAKHGDTIGISDRIIFRQDVMVGTENKTLTFLRLNEDAYLEFCGSGLSTIQNISFDGNGIDSRFPFVYVEQDITLQNDIFQNCICQSGDGGAVAIYSGKVYFSNCAFRDNKAHSGGHVLVNGATYIEFTDCTFINGIAAEAGGAVAIKSSTSFYFNGCLIRNNQAGKYGGGIYNAGQGVLSQCRIYQNFAGIVGSDYASENNSLNMAESIAELVPLFESENLKPIEWEIQQVESTYITGEKLIFDYITPLEPEVPEETEPEQPTTPEEPDTPTETEKPTEGEPDKEPDAPPQDTTLEETTPSDPETEVTDQNPNENTPSTPSNSTVDNSITGDTITNNSSSSSTDNSTSSNYTSSTTDNSRYSSTSDSNNTSTVNNYYTQPEAQSSDQHSVQTIIVPVGNAGSGEPIQQTITLESNQPERTASESADGMTINVNIGLDDTADQQAAVSIQQSGASWYQVVVLCLLSAILACLIKRR